MPTPFAITQIFKLGVERGASDVHLLVGLPPVLRIQGHLESLMDYAPLTAEEVKKEVLSIVPASLHERIEKDLTADLSFELPTKERFRLNVYHEKNGMALAARIVPSRIPTFEELDLPHIVEQLVHHKRGLVLVTGPTGAGKTTLLASMIEFLNQNHQLHIATMEDPIEFEFQPKRSIISQMELGHDFTTFGHGLTHMLRRDPDVVFIGEMRDLETMSAALTLAETGHLIFATLHTNSAAQTVERIVDVFPPHQQHQVQQQLSLTLRGIISQTLLPGTDGKLVAAREVLVSTPAVSNLIREGKTEQIHNVLLTSSQEGMTTLDRELVDLVEEGRITAKVARIYAQKRSTFDPYGDDEDAVDHENEHE